MTLSNDELTVLMIAAQGESMMPIGRWEKPVESLVAQGLLKRHDKFNNVITPEGERALAKDDDARQLIETNNAIVLAKQQMEQAIGKAARELKAATEIAMRVTGEPFDVAVKNVARLVAQRVTE